MCLALIQTLTFFLSSAALLAEVRTRWDAVGTERKQQLAH